MDNTFSDNSLDKSTYEYFVDVLNRLNDTFEDEDDKELFLKNVFKATVGNEIGLSTHSKLSHAVERLLDNATKKQLAKFIDGISKDFFLMTTHKVASHVMQFCLESILKMMNSFGENEDKNKNCVETLTTFVVNYSKWVISNLDEVLNNNYGSHVIRTLLETLSGRQVSDQILQSKKSKTKPFKPKFTQLTNTPSEFRDALRQLISKIETSNLIDLISEVSSSAVLQTILLVSSKVEPKICEAMVQTLCRHVFTHSKELGHPMANQSVTPLIEKIIDVATVSQLSKIQNKYFKGKLKKLALCPAANYVVQHLIKKCPSKEEFEFLYEELAELWDDISNAGYLGVFVALSEACTRLNVFQAKFTQRLAELLQCWLPNERKIHLVHLASKWQTFDKEKYDSKTSYHGSLILQNMFNFQKPILVSDSLLHMQTDDLINLICDPSGSHIIDSFVQSKTVGEKRRQNLIEKLKGNMVRLACDKYGSRCVETIWRSSNIQMRIEMVKEMSENKKNLRNQYGYFVYNLCELDVYTSQPKQWKNNQIRNGKRKPDGAQKSNKKKSISE